MKLNNMPKEELETLSYTDLAEMILKEEKSCLNTPTIFKKICNILELSDSEYQAQIGDFYTSLMTDKRFVLLDNACFDLRDNHAIDINLEVDLEEDLEEEESEEEELDDSEDIESEDIDAMDDEEGLDQADDLEDLTILDEDELED